MTAKMTPQTIGYGALAGATTALLCLGLAKGSVLAVLLFFLSPVPLMVAGLGFGLKAVLIGGFIALGAIIAFTNIHVAVLVALAVVAPAAVCAGWLNLARPAGEIGGPQDKLAWYPLADVLFVMAMLTGLAYVVLGVMVGFGPELVASLTKELVAQFEATNPDMAFTPEAAANLQHFMLTVVPVAQPLFWMLTLTLSLYIALTIANRSGLTRRPREDWPVSLRMPRVATFVFLAALAISFIAGGIGHIGAAFAGALGAGFTMAGFALLHARTRGSAARPLLLTLAYLSVAFVGFTSLFFFIAGVLGAGRHVPLSPAGPPSLPPHKND